MILRRVELGGSFFSDIDFGGSISAGLTLLLSDKRYIVTNTAITENTPIVASIRIVLVFGRPLKGMIDLKDVPG